MRMNCCMGIEGRRRVPSRRNRGGGAPRLLDGKTMLPHFLNRRDFLSDAALGLSGVALASLLARDRLLGDETASPYRPAIDPQRPLSARAAPLPPKAKQVLLIFCSGAVS